MPKKSTFIQDKSVPNDHFFDTFGKGVNRKISKPDLFNQIRANAQTYIYQTQAEVEKLNLQANPDNPVYFRVAENDFKLYEITTLEPGPDDFSLDNGTTATHIAGFVPDAEDIPADSPDDNVQAGLRNRVTALPDITSLSSLDTGALVDGQQFSVGSYLPNTSTGSALLRWRPDLPKSRHDGVLFFSLTVPMFTDPDDTQDYRDGAGETDPGGNGVMELVRGEIIYDATVRIPELSPDLAPALRDFGARISVGSGAELVFRLSSGHSLKSAIRASGADYSRFRVSSEDAEVGLSENFQSVSTGDLDGRDLPRNAANAVVLIGSKGPSWGILLDMAGADVNGIVACLLSDVKVEPGCGVKNSGLSNFIVYSSRAILSGAIGTGAGVRGLWGGNSSSISGQGINVSGAAGTGAHISRGTSFNLQDSIADNCNIGYDIRRSYGMLSGSSANDCISRAISARTSVFEAEQFSGERCGDIAVRLDGGCDVSLSSASLVDAGDRAIQVSRSHCWAQNCDGSGAGEYSFRVDRGVLDIRGATGDVWTGNVVNDINGSGIVYRDV